MPFRILILVFFAPSVSPSPAGHPRQLSPCRPHRQFRGTPPAVPRALPHHYNAVQAPRPTRQHPARVSVKSSARSAPVQACSVAADDCTPAGSRAMSTRRESVERIASSKRCSAARAHKRQSCCTHAPKGSPPSFCVGAGEGLVLVKWPGGFFCDYGGRRADGGRRGAARGAASLLRRCRGSGCHGRLHVDVGRFIRGRFGSVSSSVLLPFSSSGSTSVAYA